MQNIIDSSNKKLLLRFTAIVLLLSLLSACTQGVSTASSDHKTSSNSSDHENGFTESTWNYTTNANDFLLNEYIPLEDIPSELFDPDFAKNYHSDLLLGDCKKFEENYFFYYVDEIGDTGKEGFVFCVFDQEQVYLKGACPNSEPMFLTHGPILQLIVHTGSNANHHYFVDLERKQVSDSQQSFLVPSEWEFDPISRRLAYFEYVNDQQAALVIADVFQRSNNVSFIGPFGLLGNKCTSLSFSGERIIVKYTPSFDNLDAVVTKEFSIKTQETQGRSRSV